MSVAINFQRLGAKGWHDIKTNSYIIQNTKTGKYVSFPDKLYGVLFQPGQFGGADRLYIDDFSTPSKHAIFSDISIFDLPKAGKKTFLGTGHTIKTFNHPAAETVRKVLEIESQAVNNLGPVPTNQEPKKLKH